MDTASIVEPNLEVASTMLLGAVSVPWRNNEIIHNHGRLLPFVKLVLVHDLWHRAKVGEAVRSKSHFHLLLLFVLRSERPEVAAETQRVNCDAVALLQRGTGDHFQAEDVELVAAHKLDDLVAVDQHLLSRRQDIVLSLLLRGHKLRLASDRRGVALARASCRLALISRVLLRSSRHGPLDILGVVVL